MKQKIILALFTIIFSVRLQAQTYEIEQLMLDWDKLSALKNILNDLYKGYEVLTNGYNAIKDISEGNFNLHKAFLDGLVSPAVRNYRHVKDILDDQSRLVAEYKSAFGIFKSEKHFTPGEIVYLGQVYGNLFSESLKDIERLTSVITADKLRMSDAERLHAIDLIYADSKNKLVFLRQFNSDAALLALQRATDLGDAATLRLLHGAR